MGLETRQVLENVSATGRTGGGTASRRSLVEQVCSHFFGQSAFGTYADVVESAFIRVAPNVALAGLTRRPVSAIPEAHMGDGRKKSRMR